MDPRNTTSLSRSPSRPVLVLSSLVIGITATLLLTRPRRSAGPPPAPTVSEVVAPASLATPHLNPAVSDWTQSLAAPLLYLAASDYPNEAGPEFDAGETTWLHDRGLRSLYMRVGPHYSLQWIEDQVGESIFLSGPHKWRMDFVNDADFGHYNPKFFVAAQARFESLVAQPGFTAATRGAFQTHVQRQLETYVAAEQIARRSEAAKNKRIAAEYSAHLRSGSVPDLFLQEAWRGESKGLESRGADWYEANTALAFWTRRSIDGSADELKALMQRVLEVYELPSLLRAQ